MSHIYLFSLGRRRRSGATKARPLRALARSDDAGFTLVELAVASGVILTAILMVTTVISTGVTQTGVARQRQSADGLANQTLEQIRALPFATVQAGLKSTDTSADPNVTSSGCPHLPCFEGENLAVGADLANVEPLVPHQRTLNIGPTTYNVSSYITRYENDATTNTYRATVYVDWASTLSGHPGKVQVQTLIFSPAACLAPTTHPFSGPCSPSFSTVAIADSPYISISGAVAGVQVDHLQLLGTRVSSDLLVEQITRAEGLAQAPGAVLQLLGGNEVALGRQTVTSNADNDPGTALQQTGSANLTSATTPQSQTVGGITISASAGSSGSTTSTSSATSSPNTCPNVPLYTNENDSQPCSAARAATAATVSASAPIDVLGATTLASMSPQINPVAAITDINKGPGSGTPGTGTCPNTPADGDGCVRAYLDRAAADVGIAGLGLLGPIGFSEYVKVVGLTDRVTTEAGPGTNGPTVSVNAGTIRYWNGVGYSSVSLPAMSSAITIPTLSIKTNLLLPSLGTEVTLSGSIQPPSKSTSFTSVTSASDPTCVTPPGICTTGATARSTGPKIEVSMIVKVLGITVADLQISGNTGTVQAKSTYTATSNA